MTNATFSSTAPAGGSLAIMTALQMSAQVEVLVTALFVAG